MTAADLEAVIARDGHERYRWLTSDDNPDEASREGYRRIVAEKAAGTPHVEPVQPAHDFAELRNATKLGSAQCWFSERDAGCGCDGLQCHLLGRRINIYDCVACLKKW
jgi:hypothetical protein